MKNLDTLKLIANAFVHILRVHGVAGYFWAIKYLLLRLKFIDFSTKKLKLGDVNSSFSYRGKTTVIIPTRDGLSLLKGCVDSLYAKTPIDSFDLIVINNGSTSDDIFVYFDQLKKLGNVKILDLDWEFNYSKLNNAAVSYIKTEMICFLNNDTIILEEGWLKNLASLALEPLHGAVGPLLLYPDGTIQHAGIIVGIKGVARNFLAKKRLTNRFARLWLRHSRQVKAVTGACLVIEKKKFLAVNGFEELLPVGFNDVDLCLRLNSLGLKNIFTPSTRLVHLESKTRGTNYLMRLNGSIDDVIFMMARWKFPLVGKPNRSKIR